MHWNHRLAPDSLSGQLLIAYLGAWLLASAVMVGAVMLFQRNDAMQWSDHSSLSMASALSEGMSPDAQGLPAGIRWPREIEWLAQDLPLDLGYRIFGVDGKVVLWSSPQVRQAWTTALPPASTAQGPRTEVIDGIPVRLRTVAVKGFRARLWMEVGISERLIALLHAKQASRTGEVILVTAAVSVILLGLVQYLVMRRVMTPVHRLATQAAELEGDLTGRRIDARAIPLELRPLVHSFNGSLRRQEEAFTRQLRFLADAAHELKTPLSLLRCQVELGDSKGSEILRDIDHLTRQVQQLLILAEVSEPRSYRPERFEIGALITEVCELLAPMADRHGVKVLLEDSSASATLLGDRSATGVLLKNLVENAISVAPSGTSIRLHWDSRGVQVADSGPGIDPDHLESVFERFWRAPFRRDTGAGLGLAICKEVATAHGWSLSASNGAPGAVFKLQFPKPQKDGS
jgi:two-component system sensor histidine kinase QseC